MLKICAKSWQEQLKNTSQQDVAIYVGTTVPLESYSGEPFRDAWEGYDFYHGRLASGAAFIGLQIPEEHDGFEVRWVLHRFLKNHKSILRDRSLFVHACSPILERMVAKDILMLGYDALYKHCQWKSVSVFGKQGSPESLLKAELGFRGWVNENPDELTSIEIGNRLQNFCDLHKMPFESFDETRLKKEGMGLLLAVGQGSRLSPSRLHIAKYAGSKSNSNKAPIVLVGKGVTFDTGGINVKPFESYVNCMKNDMAGSAIAFHLFQYLVEQKCPHPVHLYIPCCENLVAEKSMKPGSILKAHSGKSVIIEHTDAEGRLILADALSYAHSQQEPKRTFVFATLTTAALRQFSGIYTPVHFAEPHLQKTLREAGEAHGEHLTFWRKLLPFLAGNHHRAADLTNMGRLPADSRMSSGSNVAAHFLTQFTRFPIVHFDIFASCWNWGQDYPGAGYGATGAPMHTLGEGLYRYISELD